MQTRVYEIEVSGERVAFDARAFDEGDLKLARGCAGQPCEDCTEDIAISGFVSLSEGAAVKCSCGARYEAQLSEMY